MEPSPHRMPRWVIALLLGVLVLAGSALAAWSVELPYVAFSPGPVADVVDSIRLDDGARVPSRSGELLMLTISLQDLNAFEVMAAAVDPRIDVIPESYIRPPEETDVEYQERVLEQMDVSEQNAVLVALDKLGLTVTTDGVQILSVVPDFQAAEVLEEGDLIRQVEGRPIQVTTDISDALAGLRPGDEVEVVVERGGSEQTVSVMLGHSDQDADTPVIGIRVQNVNPHFPVTIESGSIGGPSAGMMYTLAVIDLLGEDDLAKGHVIAGTGTISPDGSVGAIGGIRQKVVAAERAGAETILVPADNYEEALTAPRGDIEIVAVADIDEALSYLEGLPPV